MKLAISPTYIFSAIIGLSIVSLSSIANPGYGPIESHWIIWIGCTIFTLALTRMHASGEAKRNIPKSRKWIRVVYRGIILLALGLIAYRYEISNDNILPAAMLSLNQRFCLECSLTCGITSSRAIDGIITGTILGTTKRPN